MTVGALIFAYNNEQVDYVAMAKWSAKNIERHLGIPTHIVTTGELANTNSRHFDDLGTVTWHNTNRMDAYDVSPFDQTLVLDADYVVASNQLQTVLASSADFTCHRRAYDVTGLQTFADLNSFGAHGMPMWWATVMMFRRSTQAKIIFDSMKMIRDNWSHYRILYNNTRATYRNDHALSIALNIENGHTLITQDIPWNLASVVPSHGLVELEQDHYRIDFVTSDKKSRWIALRKQDFHAMGKRHLGDIVANNS
jgi:hypothetical protein